LGGVWQNAKNLGRGGDRATQKRQTKIGWVNKLNSWEKTSLGGGGEKTKCGHKNGAEKENHTRLGYVTRGGEKTPPQKGANA